MGGHGAITIYLSNLSRYRSVSAFAPILNPTKTAWGRKVFTGYLEGGVEEGAKYDSTELIRKVKRSENLNILIDQVRTVGVFFLILRSVEC